MAEVKIEVIGEDKASPAVAKVQSAFDTLKSNVVAFGAAAWAAIGLVNKAMEYMKLGAQALQTEQAFHNVTAAYGVDGDALLAKLKQVSAGIIDESDLMQRSLKGLQQGLRQDQLVQLLEVARSSARVAGIDVAAAFDMITNATANQAVRGLKALGIVIDQAKAFEDYARKLDIGVNALTEMQQSQALANAAIEEGTRQMKAMGEIQDTEYEKIQRSHEQIKNFQESLGKFLLTLKNAGIMLMYELGSAINTAVARILEPFVLIEKGLNKLGMAGDTWKNAQANASAASDMWHDKAKTIWQGITADTDKANAAVDAHKNKLKGLATEQSAFENERINTDRMAVAERKWRAELDASDISINETARAIGALNAKRADMEKDLGKTTATAFYDEGLSNIYKKQQQSFDDMIIDRMHGYQKDIAALDIWKTKTLKDYEQVEGAKEQITELHARKRVEIQAKYAVEATQKEIEGLKTYRAQLVSVYDEATKKAQDYYAEAARLRGVASNAKDWRANFGASELGPYEQMLAQYKRLQAQISDAKLTGDLGGMEKALADIQKFGDKFKGLNEGFGKNSSWEMKQLLSNYDDLVGRIENAAQQTEHAGNAWQSWANTAMQWINAVDVQIYNLESRVLELNSYVDAMHSYQINTDQATAAVAALAAQVDGLNAALAMSGGQRGGGTVQFLAGSDTPGYGSGNWNFPTPDMFGDGGYVTKPTFAIVGEKEPEYIIPASKMSRMQSGGTSISIGNITIQGANKDGRQLAREIDAELADMYRRKTSRLQTEMRRN